MDRFETIVMAVIRRQPFIQPFVIHDFLYLPQQMVFRNQCLQIHNDWLMPCIFSPIFHENTTLFLYYARNRDDLIVF